MFSIRVKAFRASARCDEAHMAVITPLAAGAEPDPRGSAKAAADGGWDLVKCAASKRDVTSYQDKCAISASQTPCTW